MAKKSSSKPQLPETTKAHIKAHCDMLIENVLKPRHIIPPPDDPHFNYIVDLYTLWHGKFLYFCAKYRCPKPNCTSEFFEARFTRLEYNAKDTFTLSYMRHTGKWQVVFTDLSLNECLSTIKTEEIFQP